MKETSRILYVLNILAEGFDETHPISSKAIFEHLSALSFKEQVNVISCIDKLYKASLDILTMHAEPFQCNIDEKILEPYELRILIDAVASSKFITCKKSRELAIKISGLTSKFHAHDTSLNYYIESIEKSKNEMIFHTLEFIYKAISKKSWVSFKYLEYSTKKALWYKEHGNLSLVCPYTTIWRNDQYYLIGYSKKHAKIVPYRVDKIINILPYDREWKPPPERFGTLIHINKIFQKVEGCLTFVKLKCVNSLADVIIDEFGLDIIVTPFDKDHFWATVEVCANPKFYGWVFGFSGSIEIVAPHEIKHEYLSIVRDVIISQGLLP